MMKTIGIKITKEWHKMKHDIKNKIYYRKDFKELLYQKLETVYQPQWVI